MKYSLISIFWLFLLLLSCKTDFSDTKNVSKEEQDYFEDYDSPRVKWSYINLDGDIIFDPIYDNVRDFNNGQAVVNYKGKWGLIDQNSKVLVPFEYKELSSFYKGKAIAKTFEDQYLIIGLNNDTLAQLNYQEVYPFSEGLASIKTETGWGYINTEGKVTIKPEYQSVMSFNKSKALVNRYGKKGVIDPSGKVILPLEFDQLSIHDNYYRTFKNGAWSLLDQKGKAIFDKTYSFLGIPKDEKVLIKDKSQIYIYNLETGNRYKVSKNIVEYAGEDLWIFEENDKFGLCDSDELVKTNQLYDIIYKFQEGKAAYNLGTDRWGYLNSDGTTLTPPQFPLNWSFKMATEESFYLRESDS